MRSSTHSIVDSVREEINKKGEIYNREISKMNDAVHNATEQSHQNYRAYKDHIDKRIIETFTEQLQALHAYPWKDKYKIDISAIMDKIHALVDEELSNNGQLSSNILIKALESSFEGENIFEIITAYYEFDYGDENKLLRKHMRFMNIVIDLLNHGNVNRKAFKKWLTYKVNAIEMYACT